MNTRRCGGSSGKTRRRGASRCIGLPHYHVVGLCRDFEESDPDREDGWVAKNVEQKGSHSLAPFTLHDRDGYDDMAGVIRYLLSHATFPKEGDRQVVTWFGSIHGTNFAPEKELSDGAWSVIQRKVKEVVGSKGDDSGEGGSEEDEPEEVVSVMSRKYREEYQKPHNTEWN